MHKKNRVMRKKVHEEQGRGSDLDMGGEPDLAGQLCGDGLLQPAQHEGAQCLVQPVCDEKHLLLVERAALARHASGLVLAEPLLEVL